jgi:hypothetical protein
MIWKIGKKSQLNSEKKWKIQNNIVKWYGKYGRKEGKDIKNTKVNSEKIVKILKKGKLNSEMIWKTWKKSKMNSEKIWEKGKLNIDNI